MSKRAASGSAVPQFILTMSCPDRRGIVAAIATFIAERCGLIIEAAHFVDPSSDRSFMRTTFTGDALPESTVLRADFSVLAQRFAMDWELHAAERRSRALVAVSREGHCLNSLLHRWSAGALPIQVAGIVSNHETHARLAAWYGIPFHHYPIDAGGKREQEARILQLYKSLDADVLVLARYMQILSDDACRHLAGRCINIHHSVLPGFKGARPYHQASARGVKVIGATAHYVTSELDEGPIIEQDVERVDHTMTPQMLAEVGRDLEAIVLIRAVRWHAEHRVFITGNRTVVLRS